ncbi:MAG: flagellar protein FliT [Lachnospiraceae bacterium]|nr:flagellar protein FliT [Lachnospiraceae bacterium]
MENQLTILAESLEQKIAVLAEIQEYNKRQEQVFLAETVDMSGFDEAVEEKGRLIEQLSRLDDGFEILYAKLSEQLRNNRSKYAAEIRGLQQQIATITEMSVTIQAQESRNKQLIEQYFAKERDGIRQNRKNSKAVYDYYKKVNNASYAPPQLYDTKK